MKYCKILLLGVTKAHFCPAPNQLESSCKNQLSHVFSITSFHCWSQWYHMKSKIFIFPFKAFDISAYYPSVQKDYFPAPVNLFITTVHFRKTPLAKTHTCKELPLNKCKSILLSFLKHTQCLLLWDMDESGDKNCLPISFQLLGPSCYSMFYTQCRHCIGGGVRGEGRRW